jgi:DHA1 family tetracycline resistance protein-like MFS transporter
MKPKKVNRPLRVILFTVFVDMLGFGILIPVIPLLLADKASPFYLLPPTMTVRDGYIMLGTLLATFSITQFISTPILGELSDIYGRKKILAVSLIGTCLSYIMFAIGIITQNLPLLFISRALDGVTGGNISVAQAAIADVTTPATRSKNFGLIGAAFGLGFILGPYIGGKLSDPHLVSWFGASTPFFFAAILSFINVISVIFILPETLVNRKLHVRIQWTRAISNIFKAFTLPGVNVLFVTNFFFQAGFTFFTSFFSIFLLNKFHFTQSNIGDFFSYIGVWIAITQAVITPRISTLYKEDAIVKYGLLGTAIAVLVYFVPTTWVGLLLVAPLFAIFNGLTQANELGLLSRNTDASIQGEILGINSSVTAFAQAVPPLLSGYIAAKLTPEAPIVVSAIVIALAAIVFIAFYKPVNHPSHSITPPIA